MSSPVSEIKIAVSFNGEGFQSALADYLESVSCEPYSQEWHDKVVGRAVELATEFTNLAVVTP